MYYDEINQADIIDLRNSSQKVQDYNRLIDREFNKLVAGTTRGSEGEWIIVEQKDFTLDVVGTVSAWGGTSTYARDTGSSIGLAYGTATPSISDSVMILVKGNSKWYKAVNKTIGTDTTMYLDPSYGNVSTDFTVSTTYTVVVATKSTRTKSNTLTHTDILGNPANYPTSFKQSGVFGTPLIVAEDGTSMLPTGALTTFKLSRKANATPLQVLKSTDSGVTWTILTVTTHYTFSMTPNAITFVTAPATTDLIMVTYQTHTNMATATVNGEVLAIGDVEGLSNNFATTGAFLLSSLVGKIPTSSVNPRNSIVKLVRSSFNRQTLKFDSGMYGDTINDSFTLGNDNTPAVKVFPYLTRSNGKAWLNLVFKEMKYGSYVAPTVVTAASATYTINMTYKVNIAGCALDGKVIQWTAATATSAIDWSLYDVSPSGVIYLLSSGAVYANARLYDGDSWGDNSKFEITDYVSTTTDTNGATVLIGQKRIELPYFIGAAE